MGRLATVGLLCRKHNRWLGSPRQPRLPNTDITRAELVFRRVLVPRGILFDSPVMDLALQVAARGTDPDHLAAQQAIRPFPPEAQLYPSQVKVVRLLTSRDFLGKR